MNIAFDSIAILGPYGKNRGIGNYTLSQVKAIIEKDTKNNYFFFNLCEPFSMENQVSTKNIKDFYFNSGNNKNYLNEPELLDNYGNLIREFVQQNKIDIFYLTSPFDVNFPLYRKEWFGKAKIVFTVWDLIPYVMKDFYLKDENSYKWYMSIVEMLKIADSYLVISQSVKDDMVKYLNFPEEKIKVIWGASDEKIYKKIDISESQKQDLFDRFEINKKFVMCTGGDDYRKNIEGLIRAFAKTKKEVLDNYQLVIVCKLSKPSFDNYTHIIKESNLTGKVILTNFVSTEDLIALYNLATLMAFPSKYEGFGLPVVEAWMCGTPVLTSNNSSLGQIAKDSAILVDPFSIDSITDGLNKALLESDLEDLLKKGEERLKIFNWSHVAELCIEEFENLGKSIKKSSRKKIAFFTPLPPIHSGISDYSVDILSQLSKKYDIDVYTDNYNPDKISIENVEIYVYTKFENKINEYDEIIYQIGNSDFHEYMFPILKKYSGICVIHDLNLQGILNWMYHYRDNKPEELVEGLCEDLNSREISDYLEKVDLPYSDYTINGFVANYAKCIIVHSEYGKKLLLNKNPMFNVSVVPLYSIIEDYIDKSIARRKLAIDEKSMVFSAFGHIQNTKRALQILKALNQLRKEQENFKFIFVGKLSDDNFAVSFNNLIEELNLTDIVSVTGYTTLEEFNNYMDASDICLNLRYPYNGENSASFMRLLGKGKCTIVNRIGSFAEVPEDACIMISSAENLSEQQEVDNIVKAMNLAMDTNFRSNVEKKALEYAAENLALEKIGQQYIDVIENKSSTELSSNYLEKSFKHLIIKKQTKSERYKSDDLKAEDSTAKVETSNLLDNNLLNDLNSLKSRWYLNYYKKIGKGFKNFIKRVIRKLMRPIVFDLFCQQSEYNAANSRLIDNLTKKIENLEKQIEQLKKD